MKHYVLVGQLALKIIPRNVPNRSHRKNLNMHRKLKKQVHTQFEVHKQTKIININKLP